MKKRLADLAYRRHRLLGEIEAQRMDMAEISLQWQKPLALVDVGVKAVRFINHHPAWVAGSVTALLAWRRKGVVGLVQKGWRLLYLYPSTLAFGLKLLSMATRTPSQERMTEVGH